MKKYFDIIETVTYTHRIEIGIDEISEDVFEDFAEETADAMDNRFYDSKEEILHEFVEAFGDENISFTIDGSPRVEYEAS